MPRCNYVMVRSLNDFGCPTQMLSPSIYSASNMKKGSEAVTEADSFLPVVDLFKFIRTLIVYFHFASLDPRGTGTRTQDMSRLPLKFKHKTYTTKSRIKI